MIDVEVELLVVVRLVDVVCEVEELVVVLLVQVVKEIVVVVELDVVIHHSLTGYFSP